MSIEKQTPNPENLVNLVNPAPNPANPENSASDNWHREAQVSPHISKKIFFKVFTIKNLQFA